MYKRQQPAWASAASSAPRSAARSIAASASSAARCVLRPRARATQAWQLATQARWRRVEPLGLGPVLWLWLRMRREHAQVRLAAWRLALGGAS